MIIQTSRTLVGTEVLLWFRTVIFVCFSSIETLFFFLFFTTEISECENITISPLGWMAGRAGLRQGVLFFF